MEKFPMGSALANMVVDVNIFTGLLLCESVTFCFACVVIVGASVVVVWHPLTDHAVPDEPQTVCVTNPSYPALQLPHEGFQPACAMVELQAVKL